MAGQVRVDYTGVYRLVAAQKQSVNTNIDSTARTAFTRVNRMLQDVDGATNNELLELTECSKKKARAVTNVLYRLSDYISSAAKTIEDTEAQIAQDLRVKG